MTAANEKSKRLIELLKSKGLTIAAAESCTGGAFMAALVRVSGASEVLRGGVVTYCDDVKVDVVGVERETIQQFGVVSTQTVAEMAAGVRLKFGAALGIGVTGYAGPGGEHVGKVCFGISVGKEVITVTRKFDGARGEVIDACVDFLIEWLCEKI